MSLSTIVNVQITRNTSASRRAEFGVPLFITATVPAGFTERARIYNTLEDLADDGFATSDPAYKAASAYFSQNPSVTELVIGRSDVGDADYAESLLSVAEENSDWYIVTADVHTEDDVLALAAAVEAMQKLYFVSTQDPIALEVIDGATATATPDIAKQVADLNYTRTAAFYHHTADTTFPECAFAGHNLPFLAGSSTWAYLQLNGVAQSLNDDGNPLTATQQNNLQARNCNYSVTEADITITREGKVASGEWIDIMRGVDALQDDMQKALFDLLINQKGGKVPYDDNGLNQVRNVIDSSLRRFVTRRFIQENYTITIPKAIDIAFVDKQNRVLNNVTFEAFLVGAIHEINVLGNVTYETA